MNRTLEIGIAIGMAASLGACSGTAGPGTGQVGPGSVTTGVKVSALYIANSDDTTIARLDLDTQLVRPFDVGGEPTRIARAGSRVYVSLRTERAVAVLDDASGDLKSVGRIQTGAEPFGVAANDTHVYVAASVGGMVQEFDAQTFTALRSWRLSGEPRWIAIHPSNRALFAGSTYGGHIYRIDLETGATKEVPLPAIKSFNPMNGGQFDLTPRVTGDLVIAPDGRRVYAPVLYVDNTTQIPDATSDTTTTNCGGMGGPVPPNGGGAMGAPPPSVPPNGGNGGNCGGYDHQKFNPTVVPIDTEPSSGVATNPQMALILQAAAQNRTVTNPNGFVQPQLINGYASSLQITADSKILFATIEGAGAVLAMDVDLDQNQGGVSGGTPPSPGVFPNGPSFGFSFRPLVSVTTGEGPRGVALAGDDKAYVHVFFDHAIEELDVAAVRQALTSGPKNSVIGFGGAAPNVPGAIPGASAQLTTRSHILVTASALASDVEDGRRLFYATNNPVMATVGSAVSCATCHFDGRTDGVTWTFHRGKRQTPMLAVDLRNATPVGWAGNVPTVADEGFNTSQKLMGGHGISTAQTAALQAFLYGERAIDTPMKNAADDARVQHGAQIFAQVGCIACHNGPSYTNNQIYSIMGLDQVKTRPLKGIAASAPYFHDGSAETLGDVVDRASRGEMGQPFQVSDAEKADLVLYLESL